MPRRWWRRHSRARYRPIRFEVDGDAIVPRRWTAFGTTGSLSWTARMDRADDGVDWTLTIDGVVTGTETRSGRADNAYAAGDECRAALRRAIDDHNALKDATG